MRPSAGGRSKEGIKGRTDDSLGADVLIYRRTYPGDMHVMVVSLGSKGEID
jgi:hypothetical protein